jgi:hypothetical protein
VPLRNRVSPLGELIAVPDRGLVYGNRGCLHDDEGRIRRSWAVKRWISCRLEFRGRRRHPLLQPGRFTELFFLDEATALAAGHRACGECRYEDYVRLKAFFRGLGADEIDEQLHRERRAHHDAPYRNLPDAAFVLLDPGPHLVLADSLLPWSPAGYGEPVPRPRGGRARVITPPSLVVLLAAGWQPVVPLLHPSAGA